jgi:hypothetical protein
MKPIFRLMLLLFVAGQVYPQFPTVVINEYPLPTANSSPSEITLGPDGALWFTENGGNKIGWITTAGVITERHRLVILRFSLSLQQIAARYVGNRLRRRTNVGTPSGCIHYGSVCCR